jgi:hypothetical protein
MSIIKTVNANIQDLNYEHESSRVAFTGQRSSAGTITGEFVRKPDPEADPEDPETVTGGSATWPEMAICLEIFSQILSEEQ